MCCALPAFRRLALLAEAICSGRGAGKPGAAWRISRHDRRARTPSPGLVCRGGLDCPAARPDDPVPPGRADLGPGLWAWHHSRRAAPARSEEHTSELQSLMRISYAVFCLKKKKQHTSIHETTQHNPTTNDITTR